MQFNALALKTSILVSLFCSSLGVLQILIFQLLISCHRHFPNEALYTAVFAAFVIVFSFHANTQKNESEKTPETSLANCVVHGIFAVGGKRHNAVTIRLFSPFWFLFFCFIAKILCFYF